MVLTFNFSLCSESSLNYVSIQWNVETVIIVLQFMHGSSLSITSSNFIPLLEVSYLLFVKAKEQISIQIPWLAIVGAHTKKTADHFAVIICFH